MKNFIITLLLQACFTSAYSQYETEANAKKESYLENSLHLSAEESEERTSALRKKFKNEYESLMHRKNTFNEATTTWNEYFNYARNQGPESMSAHGSWTNISCNTITHTLNKGGAMGRMHCVRVDPTNVNIVYAGSPSGGLWKSTDGGDSWTCLTDGLPRLGVADVAINPANTNEIYILTGDGDTQLTPCIGVLKSFNGGFTWQPTALMFTNASALNFNDSASVYGRKLIISPSNPNVLFAVTSSGIYKTDNGGLSWPQVFANGNIWDINFKPAFDTVLYAGGTNTFYRSIDNGTSWPAITVDAGGQRIALSTTIAAPQNVYLLVSLGGERARFYKSTDSGISFPFMYDTLNVFTGQTTLDIAIEASPSNASTIYAGILNFYKSTNGGTSFTLKTSGAWGVNNYQHVDVHDIEVRNGVIYVASDGGIYKSLDAGTTWQEKINGLSTAWITSIAHASAFPDLFYFGSFDNGFYKRTAGSDCVNLASGDGFTMAIDHTDQNTAYGMLPWIFYKTTDGGTTWNPLPLPTSDVQRLIVVDPTNANNLYLAANEVYKSTDKGATWSALFADSSYGRSCLAMGVSNPSFLYSATRPHPSFPGNFPTYFQRYNGTNWQSCKGNLPTNWSFWFSPSDVTVDPANHLHVWVTFSGLVSGQKVFETTNGGSTWFNRSGSLPNVAVSSIQYAPGSNNGVYIGTDIGVFYRDNSFTDWVPFLNGLPRTGITDLIVDPVNNSIFAATCGRGLWKSDLFTPCPVSQNFSGTPANQNGFHLYEAAQTIESDRHIDGSYGNNVTYKAGNFINLVPGFEAKAGSLVTARIGPCTGIFPVMPLTGNLEESSEKDLIGLPGNSNVETSLTVFPNPFNEVTTIQFVSQNNSPISIALSDLMGRNSQKLIDNENFSLGSHQFNISTAGLSQGVYFITLSQSSKVLVKKITKL